MVNRDDKINYYLPLFAIKLGATVIEKHITYDRTKKGIETISLRIPILKNYNIPVGVFTFQNSCFCKV